MNTILSKLDPQWWLQQGHWGLSFTLKLMAIHDTYIKSFPLLLTLLYFTAQCVISQKPGKMNWRPIHKAQQKAYNPIHQMKGLRGPIQCRVELGQDSSDEEGNWRQFLHQHQVCGDPQEGVQILKLQVVWDHSKGPTVTQPNLWTTTNPFTITLKFYVHHRACLINYPTSFYKPRKKLATKPIIPRDITKSFTKPKL